MHEGERLGCQACLVSLTLIRTVCQDCPNSPVGCNFIRIDPLAINEEITSTNRCSHFNLPGMMARLPTSMDPSTCCCCSRVRTSFMPNLRVSSFRLSLALHLRMGTRSSSVANLLLTLTS